MFMYINQLFHLYPFTLNLGAFYRMMERSQDCFTIQAIYLVESLPNNGVMKEIDMTPFNFVFKWRNFP